MIKLDDLHSVLQEQNFDENREYFDFSLFDFLHKLNNDELYTKVFTDLKNDNFYGSIICIEEYIRTLIEEEFGRLKLSSFVNNPSSISSLAAYVYQYIINFYFSKILIFEKDIAFKHLLKDENKNHTDFINIITNSLDWIVYLFKKYPTAYFLISDFIENQIKYIKTIGENLNKDELLLKNDFGAIGSVVMIEIAKGDLHNNNRSVCKVVFEEGEVYYKPRSYRIDQIIKNILDNSNTILDIPFFKDMGEYGYSESIRGRNVDSISNDELTSNYFFEIGKALRLIQDLQFEDIINDNVIYSNNKLYLIDLESVLVPKKVYSDNYSEKITLNEMHSPLSTGCLPTRQGVNEYCNSIFLPSKVDLGGTIRELSGKQFFQHTFKKSDFDIHLPEYYTISSKEHFSECCKMLKKGFLINVLQDVESLELINNEINTLETRIIFRETVRYFQLLMHCRAPEFMTSTSKYFNQLAVILPTNHVNTSEKVIKNSEFTQLKAGDIPIFIIQNNNLVSDKGEVIIRNYYSINDRIINFNRPIDYSNLLIETLKYQLPDLDFFEHNFKDIKEESITDDIHWIQNRIFQYLKSTLHSFQNGDAWITTYIDEEKVINRNQYVNNVALMRTGLYDGTDGLIYSINRWIKRNDVETSDQKEFKNILEQTLETAKKNLLNPSFNSKGSLFNAPYSGYINIASSSLQGGLNDITKYTDAYLKKVIKILNRNDVDDTSFFSGIASSCLFIQNNKNLFSDSIKYEEYFQKLTTYIESNVIKTKTELDDIDASNWCINNSLSGDFILLKILLMERPDTNNLKTIYNKYKTSLKTSINQSLDKINSSNYNQSWLSGYNGMISIALGVEPFFFRSEIIYFYNTRKKNFYSNSFSLSGGRLGSLSILNEIERTFDLKKDNWAAGFVFKDFFNLRNDQIVKTMLSKGLYNGICGFLEIDYQNLSSPLVPSHEWMKIEKR